jgi:16S rRNA (guanine966-N2)-methyltransferase
MRVVGGRWRGRALAGPRSEAIRPTSDRLREAIFNILAHGHDDPVPAARVLDLFAGTGAMGIEALSRGAAFTLFVDDGAEARALLRGNIETLGLGGVTKIFRRDATRMGDAGSAGRFRLAFCDPPYGKGLAARALAGCAAGGWLEPGALVVVEETEEATDALPSGFELLDRRTYGGTQVLFARYAG